MLREYDAIVPGMADRITHVFEKSATGQIDIADRLATAEIETAKQGLALAFFLTLIAFAASIYFFIRGNNVAGVAFLSVPVVMLIRSFIQRSGSQERPDS